MTEKTANEDATEASASSPSSADATADAPATPAYAVDESSREDAESPARQTSVDDENDEPETVVGSEDPTLMESVEIDLERIRMPKPRSAFVPIKLLRLVHDRGATQLRLLPPEDAPTDLTYPDAPFGDWERHLAKGEVSRVREAIPESELGEAGDDKSLTDEQARKRDILARVAIMDGEVEAAQALLKDLRGDPRVCAAEACLAVGEGDVEKAQKCARTALDREPEGVVAHYVNALVCVAEGDYQRGFEELAAVSRASPEHAVARHQLGQLTYATGDPARAGTLFEQASEIAPAFLPPSLTLSEMLIESRQYGEALAILTKAAEAAPDALAPRLLELRILLEVGDDESAVRLADVLHSAAPHHPDVSRMWADAMLRAGREDEAKTALEALLPQSQGPSKAQALRLLAKVDMAQGNSEAARGRLFEAVQAAPEDGELVLELAQTLFRTGASEEASEALFAFAKRPEAEVGHLLNGAMLARENGDDDLLAALATASLQRVAGTPAEPQVHAVLTSIGVDLSLLL